ncbi:regucalcin-like isoform X3 [Galleria mellonella]|uniref:Regucalcin n=1 Tax=Galleria mellonella TaxID=7137 RepID=A0ABM3MTW0_GALME|nr:regucalcin-like isoform X3 [Galleria mellonella]
MRYLRSPSDLIVPSFFFMIFILLFNYPMGPTLRQVVEPVTLGEGPHWDAEEQALYFISTNDYTINKYVPASGKHTTSKLDGRTTFIIPIEGKRCHFVVGLERKVVEVRWAGEDGGASLLRTIVEVDQEYPDNRFNDAKADPRGRLFAGTMGAEYEPGKFHLKRGSLYRIDPDGKVHKLEDNIDISNGMCWDVGRAAFYFADSFEYAIRRYDYNVHTGDISANPKIIFKYKDHRLEGIPDGMTIDTDGNLWVANFDGHRVLKIDPRTGSLLEKIRIPALQVTSVTFGGPALEDLYVTSACVNRGVEQTPPAGSTFVLTNLGVKGYPNLSVKMN